MSKIDNCLKKKIMVFINKVKLIKKASTIFLHKLNTKDFKSSSIIKNNTETGEQKRTIFF